MIRRVEVARAGAALAVELSDGTRTLVRGKDLPEVLGEPRPGNQRFCQATSTGDGVEVQYGDGSTENIPARLLLGTALDADQVTLVIDNIGVLMTCDGHPDAPLGLVRDAVVCAAGTRISWAGPRDDLPRERLPLDRAHRIDVGGRLVTPGLIDPHTHPLFAGDRSEEFARRSRGASYQEIAAAGGGIAATVQPTREASLDDHVALTCARMAEALAHGTTTCEAKSGYALTVAGELRLLEAAAVVDAVQPVDLVPTLLAAHALPPERSADRAGFVAEAARELVPQAATLGLCTSVDVYCDEGAFCLEETRTILEAARTAGLGVRAHVGQFADLGGAELLAQLGALSADHLENVSDQGIAAMARQGVVGVMLPGACIQLRMQPPPVAAFRRAGMALALGTDLNPGTSHSENLALQMWLATTHYGMTVDEAWLGVTVNAARALARPDIGRISAGARADLVIWDAETPSAIPYHYGSNLVGSVVKSGRVVTLHRFPDR
jgi:imidazolonepropionase